jgi:hypothetical protein
MGTYTQPLQGRFEQIDREHKAKRMGIVIGMAFYSACLGTAYDRD